MIGSSSIDYKLCDGDNELNDESVIEIPSDNNEAYPKWEKTLKAELKGTSTPVYAGTYCDTLTFTVSTATEESEN
jgi:hypothetical protein